MTEVGNSPVSRPSGLCLGAGAVASDDPAAMEPVDPWALRTVTFSCLDSSPNSPNPELLVDFLMETGSACSTAITDHDRDTDLEVPVFREPGEGQEEEWPVAPALVCGDAAVGTNVWHRCDVTAYVPATVDVVDLAETIRVTFDLSSTPRYTVDDVPDRDWIIHVQSAWKPIVAHGFVLRFPWHTDEDVVEALSNALSSESDSPGGSAPTAITLQGGIAFGTGEHPTTRLCLGFLSAAVRQGGARRILDYGCGSGVLGLAACALSEDVTAVGVDIDVDAVAIANANAGINGDLPMESYLPPDRMLGRTASADPESASIAMRGAAAAAAQDQKGEVQRQPQPLPSELDTPQYDACAANILAGPLVGLAPTLSNMVRTGGIIGLSGVLSDQADRVVEAYSEFFSDVKVHQEEGGWVLITGTRGTNGTEEEAS